MMEFVGNIILFGVFSAIALVLFAAIVSAMVALGGIALVLFGGQLIWNGNLLGWLMVIPGIILVAFYFGGDGGGKKKD